MGPSVASVSTNPPPPPQSSSKASDSSSTSESFETKLHQVKHAQSKKSDKPKPADAEDAKSARTLKKSDKNEPTSQNQPAKTNARPTDAGKHAAGSQSKSEQRSKEPRQKPEPKTAQPGLNAPVVNPASAVDQLSTPTSDPVKPTEAADTSKQVSAAKIQKPLARPLANSADEDENTDAKSNPSSSDPTTADDAEDSDTPTAQQPLSIPTKARRSNVQTKASVGTVEHTDNDKSSASGSAASTPITSDLGAVGAAGSAAPAPPSIDPKSKDDQKSNPFDIVPLAGSRSEAPSQAGPSSKPAAVDSTAQFAELNHPKLVTAIHGQLLPSGGTMTLRLDPPELGAMHVRVEVRDGLMTASFETSSDQATKLLSHSLDQLKSSLEAQGMTVEKLHVTQTSRPQSSSSQNGQQEQSGQKQDSASQQEQQRREMMQRLWRRLLKGQDPLDLVA